MRFADKTTLYIPSRFIGMLVWDVAELIKSITQRVGGVTIEPARGGYVMADGSLCMEPISKVVWWHRHQEPAMCDIYKIARILLHRGEEAVLVEYQRAAGTTARLLTSEDVQENDDDC